MKNLPLQFLMVMALYLCGEILANDSDQPNSKIEIWWQNIDDSWCLLSEDHEYCLPAEFAFERIGQERIEFSNTGQQDNMKNLVVGSFLWEDATRLIEDIDQSFVLIEERSINAMTRIRMFGPNPKSSFKHNVNSYVVEFGTSYTLTIAGSRESEVNELIDELIKKWQ